MLGGIGGYHMPIAFDRSLCCDLNETSTREWLITNGVGGYAAGTVAGMLTRMEHGLLVSSPEIGRDYYLSPGEGAGPYSRGEGSKMGRAKSGPDMPWLLLAKMDEEVEFDRRVYYLGTNEYKDGTLNPAGFVHLETFRLEEGFPVFTYHLGGIDGMMLEKRIWMPQGLNTTLIQYRLLRTTTYQDITPWSNRASRPAYTRFHDAQRALSLTLLPFVGYRPNNETQQGNLERQFRVETQHLMSDDD